MNSAIIEDPTMRRDHTTKMGVRVISSKKNTSATKLMIIEILNIRKAIKPSIRLNAS